MSSWTSDLRNWAMTNGPGGKSDIRGRQWHSRRKPAQPPCHQEWARVWPLAPKSHSERKHGWGPQHPFLDAPCGGSGAPTSPVGPPSPAGAVAVNGAALSG